LVRWRGLIRAVLPAIIIFIVGPLIVVTIASGQNINTILALILLLQLYVIIIQAEITLRQNALATFQYDPTLVGVVERPSREQRIMVIRNAGKQPALNVYVSLVDTKTGGPMAGSDVQVEQFRNLEPNETIPVLNMPTQEYSERPIQLRVSYWNILGEWKETTLLKQIGDGQFLSIGGIKPDNGVFLRSLENLSLIYTVAKLGRHTSKITQKETT
jgi:hypothetical protein